MKMRPRGVADRIEGVVLAASDLCASPERVFAALTTDEVVKWWGADDRYRTTRYTLDPRPGGHWRVEGIGDDGANFHVEGTVLEISPPRRLVHTWTTSWSVGAPTAVTYSLEPHDRGTRLIVPHTGFADQPQSCDEYGQGWERVLGWLQRHLDPAADGQAFLCRLLPPRPTFAQDMTPDERAIMQAHSHYWHRKLAEGVAIAFGPVADPSGSWGLGIVQVQDEAELTALQAADPAIESGRGFRYESLPLIQLVH